tara:strand:+ start:1350 stop:2234 length:885 start_codon:yes stop_codon:yes gene_type:complete
LLVYDNCFNNIGLFFLHKNQQYDCNGDTMAIVYLVGGTGNQLFQYAASSSNDKFSNFFLKSFVRRRFGWTNHEEAISFPGAPWYIQTLGIVLLSLDLILATKFGFSLFSRLDLRRVQANAMISEINKFGYFQNDPQRRDISHLATQISPDIHEGRIAVHVRGGDLLKIEHEGRNIYGMLNSDYFSDALEEIYGEITVGQRRDIAAMIITDDPEYASSLNISPSGISNVEICQLSLRETLSVAIGADWFVASNSTLSYWIIKLRDGKRCIAPKPFQKRCDFAMPSMTNRVLVNYK